MEPDPAPGSGRRATLIATALICLVPVPMFGLVFVALAPSAALPLSLLAFAGGTSGAGLAMIAALLLAQFGLYAWLAFVAARQLASLAMIRGASRRAFAGATLCVVAAAVVVPVHYFGGMEGARWSGSLYQAARDALASAREVGPSLGPPRTSLRQIESPP